MRKSRVLLVALLSLAILAPNFASADTKPVEQFWDQGPGVKEVPGYTGILVEDALRLTGGQSWLIAMYYEQKNGIWVQKESFTCRTYADPNCTNADALFYHAVLDVCEGDADTNCIVGVTAIKDGKEIPGKFATYYPDKSEYTFTGDPARKIPDGGLPSLWSFDGITHQGGDKFLVMAKYSHPMGYWGEKTSVAPSQFNSGIFAMSVSKDPTYPGLRVRTGKADSSGKSWYSNGPEKGCVVVGPRDEKTGECGLSWPLPTAVRYRLEIRTSIPLTSFMHGRLSDPVINISTDSANRQVFSVEGGPVDVPVLSAWVKNTDMPKGLRDYLYSINDFGGNFIYDDKLGNGRDSIQLLQQFDQYDANGFKEYLWWLEVAKDKSIGSKSMWIARTLSQNEIWSSGTSGCLSNNTNLTGIVTTNANMYISAPPVFNTATQSLDYQVSSPHFDDKGKLNVGNYNLVLSSEAARCLYNFSKAPISATVSIVSSDGTSQVATTNVNEKDGWLYLSANGFTFSAPTVRVKLTQEAPAPVVTPTPVVTEAPSTIEVAAPIAAQKPNPIVARKITITCVKGKAVKKVTAVKPVCPKGYKKK